MSHRTDLPAPGSRNLGQEYQGTVSARVAVGADALVESLDHATSWAEHGYSEESRAYWAGVRDTLRVVMGATTVVPSNGTEDPAAVVVLGAQHRASLRVKD